MEVHYGERGIIGLINISSCVNLEPELYAMAPDGIAILTGRVSLPKTNPEELRKLAGKAKDMAGELATAKPDLIVFACTSGSFINGKGYDREVSEMLGREAGGIPVLTPAFALLRALETLNVRKISFGSPYVEEVNESAKRFFTDNGYKVEKIEGLGLETDYEIGLLDTESICNLARSVNVPESEVIILSCTNLKTAPIIEKLEKELGKPVISANQATLWCALRMMKIKDKIQGLGKLMRMDMEQKNETQL